MISLQHFPPDNTLASTCDFLLTLSILAQVALGHMSCVVDDSEGEQRVTFLYKLAPGPCPKSFGINVARLAQLPNAVSGLSRKIKLCSRGILKAINQSKT